MKKAVLTFFNKPVAVIATSLVIAIAIGGAVTVATNSSPKLVFAAAGPGTISIGGEAGGATGIQHLTLGFPTGGRVQDVSVQIGDTVKKDEVLASLDPENTAGALTQAKAAYAVATANYQKVLNGATGPTIDASRAALNTATVNRDQVERQQDVLVKNAYTALLNATPQAYPEDPGDANEMAPTISGSYVLGKEGDIVITTYASAADSGFSFKFSGLVSGIGTVTDITPQPLGNSGLYIQFPNDAKARQTWIISLPNQKAPDYIAKSAAYQSALQNQKQTTATAEAAVEQAQSNVAVVAAAARPEDVAAAQAQVGSAQGALQIAEAAYNSRIIHAPGDGTVTAVHITPGQIASLNAPAIELSGTAFSQPVAVMVPTTAIITRNGTSYVTVQTSDGDTQEKEVVIGISDSKNTEIRSGLSAGDQVAIQQ